MSSDAPTRRNVTPVKVVAVHDGARSERQDGRGRAPHAVGIGHLEAGQARGLG